MPAAVIDKVYGRLPFLIRAPKQHRHGAPSKLVRLLLKTSG